MWYNYSIQLIFLSIRARAVSVMGGGVKLDIKIKEISNDALAYLIDTVLEIRARELLVRQGISGSGNLNKASLSYVKATEQAAAMMKIIPLLSEEEEAVYKRGRNMSGGNVPKSAKVSEYRIATGMEVLFGYLHLCGRTERIDELFAKAYSKEEN